MAFFGLTALGPQNCFQVSLLDFSYLDVFTVRFVKNVLSGPLFLDVCSLRRPVYRRFRSTQTSAPRFSLARTFSSPNQALDIEKAFNLVDQQKRGFLLPEQVSCTSRGEKRVP